MNMKTSELHASCCLGSHKSYWKIKRIRSTALPLKAKQFTSQLPIISSYEETFPQLPCVITGIFIDCQVYISSSVVYHGDLIKITAVDAVSGIQVTIKETRQHGPAKRLQIVKSAEDEISTHHRMVELNIGLFIQIWTMDHDVNINRFTYICCLKGLIKTDLIQLLNHRWQNAFFFIRKKIFPKSHAFS